MAEHDKPDKMKRVVGKRCVAAGCANTNAKAGIAMFLFPTDERRAKAWAKKVKQTRAGWKTHTKYSVLCSEHFERSCFEEGPLSRVEMGIKTKRPLVLKPGVLSTIFKKAGQVDPSSKPTASITRTAFQKRERMRVSNFV